MQMSSVLLYRQGTVYGEATAKRPSCSRFQLCALAKAGWPTPGRRPGTVGKPPASSLDRGQKRAAAQPKQGVLPQPACTGHSDACEPDTASKCRQLLMHPCTHTGGWAYSEGSGLHNPNPQPHTIPRSASGHTRRTPHPAPGAALRLTAHLSEGWLLIELSTVMLPAVSLLLKMPGLWEAAGHRRQ